MRRFIIIAAIGVGVVASVTAIAQTPTETPFPSPKVQGAFVRVQTWTSPTSNYLTNFFPQGAVVSFRMWVGDNKTRLAMTDKDLQFAKILIPNQPDVEMKYTNGDPNYPWTGTWKVPADYTPGIVGFQASIKTKKSKAYGSFVQIPVASSMLTVTKAG